MKFLSLDQAFSHLAGSLWFGFLSTLALALSSPLNATSIGEITNEK